MKPLSDLWLLIRCYPFAKACVLNQSESDYIGSVRMQIAYNEVRSKIVKAGIRANSKIVGAVVYIAISLAYLFNKRY